MLSSYMRPEQWLICLQSPMASRWRSSSKPTRKSCENSFEDSRRNNLRSVMKMPQPMNISTYWHTVSGFYGVWTRSMGRRSWESPSRGLCTTTTNPQISTKFLFFLLRSRGCKTSKVQCGTLLGRYDSSFLFLPDINWVSSQLLCDLALIPSEEQEHTLLPDLCRSMHWSSGLKRAHFSSRKPVNECLLHLSATYRFCPTTFIDCCTLIA